MPFKVIMPNLGAASESSTLLKWLVQEGDPVKIGDPLFEAESDKAVIEVESAAQGKIAKLMATAGEVITAGQVIAWILEPGEIPLKTFEKEVPVRAEMSSTPAAALAPDKPAGLNQRIIITPVARRLARTEGVDISSLKGSGPRGRIVQEDVQTVIEARSRAKDNSMRVHASQEPSRLHTPLSSTRKIVAQRMADSAKTAARVTLTCEASGDELVSLRSRLQNAAGAAGEKISYDLLLARITGQALQDYPILNTSWGEDEILYHEQVNIGIAVDTERGLLAPVLKNINGRTLLELAEDYHELVSKARAGKITPDDLSGGTFTITNLGMYGVDFFTPIINLPECAVLGIGRIRKQPVERNGQLALGQVISISLSFDHRIVDGAPAARFLQRITQLIEAPDLLFLYSTIGKSK
jgi:pyruvate dehydrogenase E2 component (dihydrolipoamide acetyltransferase)